MTEAEDAAACFESVNAAIAADFDLDHQLGWNDIPTLRNGAYVEGMFFDEEAHFTVNGSGPFGVFW